MYKLEDFYYELPEELIAQKPSSRRDESRLMILDPPTGLIGHKSFKDLLYYLNEGDCLVLNDTRVIPARLNGTRLHSGGKVELVLLKDLGDDKWEVLAGPGKKALKGDVLTFGDNELIAEVLNITEGGNRIVKLNYSGIFNELLDRIGVIPLPPYIKDKIEDTERYQTIYSKNRGSAAAPTAGLHFTKELLEAIKRKGVSVAYLTLHVGLGTFRPVKAENIKEHIMHSEYYDVPECAASLINSARERGGRIIAVGTTSLRVLETVAADDGNIKAGLGWTDIFIYPGYKFKAIDCLITNFHLPGSTLLMLVSAFAGRDFIMRAYKEAIYRKYRFFSFGDAMLIMKNVTFDDR